MREELSSVGCFIPSNYVPETFIFLFAANVFAYIDNSTSQHAFAWNAQGVRTFEFYTIKVKMIEMANQIQGFIVYSNQT